MSKKKLTNKQKKLYGTLLAVAIILILAFVKGKDIKLLFSNLVESGVDGNGLSESELKDLLVDTLTAPPENTKDNSSPENNASVTPTQEPDIPTSTVAPTRTPEPSETVSPTETPEPIETPTPEPTKSPLEQVEEDGIYSTPDLVAAYIHTFHKLPSNFITKNEASKLGWNSKEGNLWDVTDEMSIGGDRFGNYEKLLPDKKGRTWYECDVNYNGGYRGGERIVYSDDGLIYYTDDHYESFTQLY